SWRSIAEARKDERQPRNQHDEERYRNCSLRLLDNYPSQLEYFLELMPGIFPQSELFGIFRLYRPETFTHIVEQTFGRSIRKQGITVASAVCRSFRIVEQTLPRVVCLRTKLYQCPVQYDQTCRKRVNIMIYSLEGVLRGADHEPEHERGHHDEYARDLPYGVLCIVLAMAGGQSLGDRPASERSRQQAEKNQDCDRDFAHSCYGLYLAIGTVHSIP